MTTERSDADKQRIANLRNIGHATRFGGERGNPRSQELENTNRPWSIRHALRQFARIQIDPSNPKAIADLLKPGKQVSLAEYAAIQALIRATKSDRAIAFVTEQIDGKLATTNINADVSVILGMSDAELEELANQPVTITDASYSEVGNTAPGGSEGVAGGETAGHVAPGNATGV